MIYFGNKINLRKLPKEIYILFSIVDDAWEQLAPETIPFVLNITVEKKISSIFFRSINLSNSQKENIIFSLQTSLPDYIIGMQSQETSNECISILFNSHGL